MENYTEEHWMAFRSKEWSIAAYERYKQMNEIKAHEREEPEKVTREQTKKVNTCTCIYM